MINLKPEGRKKRGLPPKNLEDGIYTAMSERDLRMGEWNNRRQWNMEVGRRCQTFKTALYIYIYIYVCVCVCVCACVCVCVYVCIFIHSFIHLVLCLTTGPKPLPK